MTNFYTRQHTFINGVTAEGTEVEDEFVAIDAAFDSVAIDIAAAEAAAEADRVAAAASAAAAAQSAIDAANVPTSTITVDTTLTVGTGGTYAKLADVMTYLFGKRVKPGVTITLSILSNITELTTVTFTPGVRFALTGSGSTTLTGASVADLDAYYIPQGCEVVIPFVNGPSLTISCTGDNFAMSVLRNDGMLTLNKDLVITAASNSSSKYLVYSPKGGVFIKGTESGGSSAKVTLDNNGGTSAGVIYGGKVYGMSFVANSEIQTDPLSFYSSNIDTELFDTSVTHNLYRSTLNAKINTGSYFRSPVGVYDSSRVSLSASSGSPTCTADTSMSSPFISCAASSLVIDNVSIDISALGSGEKHCIEADASNVIAHDSVFTGAAGDYALYGTNGSTLQGSGNTYTTLTASNLTSTWAAGGIYQNA